MFLTKTVATVALTVAMALSSQQIYGQRRQQAETAALSEIGSGIGESETEFATRAKRAGFSSIGAKEDDGLTLIEMSGRLGSQRRCKLLTATSNENGRKILHASIFLPERSSWAELKADYDWMKDGLTKAYGKPKECSESATTSTGDDKATMAELKADKVDYTTKFEDGGLTIMLSITYTAEHGAHVGTLFIGKAVSENILRSVGGDI